MPTAEAKAHAWTRGGRARRVPNETMRSIAFAFNQPGQDEVLRPYLAEVPRIADTIWEERGVHHASTVLDLHVPDARSPPRRRWTQSTPGWRRTTANPAARRLVCEGRDDVARALAAQAKRRRGLTACVPPRVAGKVCSTRRRRPDASRNARAARRSVRACRCGGVATGLASWRQLLQSGQQTPRRGRRWRTPTAW